MKCITCGKDTGNPHLAECQDCQDLRYEEWLEKKIIK